MWMEILYFTCLSVSYEMVYWIGNDEFLQGYPKIISNFRYLNNSLRVIILDWKGNWFCASIILKIPNKTEFSIRNTLFSICIIIVWIETMYILLEKTDFHKIIKGYWYTILLFGSIRNSKRRNKGNFRRNLNETR